MTEPKTITRSELERAIERTMVRAPMVTTSLEVDGQEWATVGGGPAMLVVDDPPAEPEADAPRFDFPRALAGFLDREDVSAVLRTAGTDPFGIFDLRGALLDAAWALEPDDPADGSPLPGGPATPEWVDRCPCGEFFVQETYPEPPRGEPGEALVPIMHQAMVARCAAGHVRVVVERRTREGSREYRLKP